MRGDIVPPQTPPCGETLKPFLFQGNSTLLCSLKSGIHLQVGERNPFHFLSKLFEQSVVKVWFRNISLRLQGLP